MTLPTNANWILAGLMCGALTICGGGWTVPAHAQSPETPVQDVEELGILRKLMLTLQMIMAPGTRDQIGPLYAYDPTSPEISGSEVRPERIGGVATVSRCSGEPGEEAGWCARYFDHTDDGALLAAYQTAYRATVAGLPTENQELAETNQLPDPRTTYFATTYPLPNIEPERRFVWGLSR